MIALPFFQVDAFAERPLTGNPAAVIPLDHWLDDALMQPIAAENNLSETAFTVPSESGEADYDLRWFTPQTRSCPSGRSGSVGANSAPARQVPAAAICSAARRATGWSSAAAASPWSRDISSFGQ